jgi:hypothetical protein
MRGLQLVVADAEAGRKELMDRGVECSQLMVLSPDDGGTFFGFSDPDGTPGPSSSSRFEARSR